MVILAAVDETERSKRAVAIAHDLAGAYGDRLVVLHVVPREDYEDHRESLQSVPEFRDFSLDQEAGSAARFAGRVVEQALDETGERTGEGGGDERSAAGQVEIETRGRVGDVPTETLAEAERLDARYLVVGGRRRSPTGKAIFGDRVQQILLNADCPVVTKLSE